jgi:hypothetical protein
MSQPRRRLFTQSLQVICAAICAGWLLGMFTAAQADPPTFERDVRPVLKTYCLDCHGGGEKLSGNLDLRLKRFAVKGGDSGPAIVPGNAAESLLIERIKAGEMPPTEKKVPAEKIPLIEQWIAAGALTGRDEPEQLPPGIDITPEERSFWSFRPIQRPDVPRFAGAGSQPTQTDIVRTPIDAFLLARLRASGLRFAPPADRLTFIRRVAFDLTGLPPDPDEIGQFLGDQSADCYERMLEHFLQSPHYGERWGRHWLDVAGYADSEGNGTDDTPRPYAYKYRDYVIRSFNADKPFDRFIIEQMAGDELVPQPWTNMTVEQIDILAATGFLRMGIDGTATRAADEPLAANTMVADTIKIVSSSLLGLTVGCAQCHDHKYDPIPQSDYFRFRSVFEPALDPAHWRRPSGRLVSLYTDADRAKAAAVNAEANVMQTEFNAKQARFVAAALEKELEKHPEDQREALRDAYSTPADKRSDVQKKLLADNPSVNISPGILYQYNQPAADELKKDQEAINAKAAERPVEDFVSVTSEIAGVLPVTHMFYRGDYRQPKQAVTPGDLTIAAPEGQRVEIADKDPAVATSGRRLALARHLMSGKHPLVGRVLANRLWLHHFGRGFVETPGDFGMLGTRPTHPELLDWLADEFARQGWSLKQMHRLIMTSTVYRQSSVAVQVSNLSVSTLPHQREQTKDGQVGNQVGQVSNLSAPSESDPQVRIKDRQVGNLPHDRVSNLSEGQTGQVGNLSYVDARRIDSENSLYWHFPLKRLEAEALRDRMLAASGRLDRTQFGPAVAVEENFAGQVVVKEDKPRRGIYLQVRRTKPVSFLTTFDAPVMTVNCERRVSSTGAVQSLTLMNSESVLKEAEIFANRVRSQTPADFAAELTGPLALKYPRHNAAWQYGFGTFDDAAKRVSSFAALPHFTGSAWQGGPALPDPTVGWAILHAAGGHAGNDQQHAVIRRWTAPRSGVLAIGGKLKHSSENGDGVRGRIVSSRQGLLVELPVKACEVETNVARLEVEAGEMIDFMTDCLGEVTSDSFEWNPQLKLADAANSPLDTWDSAADFHGPINTNIVEQIAYAWQIAYERPATAEELELACQFVARQIEALRAAGDKSDRELVALTSLCQQLFSSNEFLHVD